MKELQHSIQQFAKEREWQGFHSPKNLVMALSVEVSELMEYFQWLTEDESRNLDTKRRNEVKDEIGDVMIYLANLCHKLDIDPILAAKQKLEKAKERYPVEKAKGRATKYTDL